MMTRCTPGAGRGERLAHVSALEPRQRHDLAVLAINELQLAIARAFTDRPAIYPNRRRQPVAVTHEATANGWTVTFDEEDEAVRLANATEYGLVAYAFTRDFARATRLFEALETGMVGINQGIVSNPAAPFGGVKASGLGREGCHYGADDYVELKYIALGGLGS